MADESLLEEMRAAVRGDRQRAAERRAGAPPPEQPVADEIVETEPPAVENGEPEPAQPGWWQRLTRRQQST